MLVVKLIRFGRKELYKLSSAYNAELVDKIKQVPKDMREWNVVAKEWYLTALGVYTLITLYKGRKDDIHFQFENEKQRTEFGNIINKHRNRIAKEQARIDNLNDHNQEIIDYKDNLPTLTENFDYGAYLKPNVVPMPHQVYSAHFAKKLLENDNSCLFAMDMGTGKAARLDSLLLTPNGYVKMGDIKVGDEVIGKNGKGCKVTGVFPQGEKDIYEVLFSDNTKTECCDEHLWTVRTSSDKYKGAKWRTFELKEIVSRGVKGKDGNNKWEIPLVEPIHFNSVVLPIDPYVMGCILGDGGISVKNAIGFTSADQEIVDEISIRLPEDIILRRNKFVPYGYRFVNKNNSGKVSPHKNILNNILKDLKLTGCNSHNKFIPELYKLSSINDRIELLQGLLDTDGTVGLSTKHKNIHGKGYSLVYTSVSKKLIEDVKFIVQSLGGTGKIRKEKIDKNGFRSFNISISLPSTIKPFKLTRKNDLYIPKTKYQPYRKIKEVNFIGKYECQCISVDAEDNLYLTNDCIVTHNTISSLLAVEMMADIKKVLFIVPANLRLNIQDEVHKFTNSFCYVPQVKKKAKTGEYYLTKYKRNIKPIEECKYIVMSYDYFADSKFDSNLKILSMGLHMVDMIVFDEMHMITNKKANRTSNITKTYGLIVKKYLGLSATPLRGNIEKFFPILKLLKPEEYRNESKFLEEYAGMRYMQGNGNNRGGLVKVSEPKFDKLNESLQTLMYRVKKEEVLKDLPPLMRNKILIELTPKEMQEYKKIEEGFAKVDWYNTGVTVTETQEKSALGIMIRIRQYLAMVKTRKSIELMHELNDYGEKCLVFDMFKDPLYSILPQMRTPTKLYSGDINMDEKQNLIYEFQEEKNLKNMLLTTGAGAVGITLTEARNVILQTLSLSPDENEQAIARAYRKGQNHSVFAYTLVVADTLDEEIYDYLSEKQAVFNSVIDGTEYIDMSEEKTIEDILEKMKLKYNV